MDLHLITNNHHRRTFTASLNLDQAFNLVDDGTISGDFYLLTIQMVDLDTRVLMMVNVIKKVVVTTRLEVC